MTIKCKKTAAAALAIVTTLTLFIYFTGPKTNYTGLARLLYNTGYISTFCHGRKIIYSGDGFRFSFLALKGMGIEHRIDKYGNTIIWLLMGPDSSVGIFPSKSTPEAYKKIIKNIAGSERIPTEMKAKITREGMTLDTLPWIISDGSAPYYPRTNMLVIGSIKKVMFKNGIPAVTFAIDPDPFIGGNPTQYTVFLDTKGQLCEITNRSMDFTVDYSIHEMWYFHNSTAPLEFPSPSQDKKTQSQLNEIANSLEFI